jgi:hypothetical protein
MAEPPPVSDSLCSPIAAAARLAQLGVALRAHQLGSDGVTYGGVCAEPLPADDESDDAAAGDAAGARAAAAPSFELTCGAVWAWGAATRAGGYRDDAAAEAQLFEVARAAAWQFLVAAAAQRDADGGLSARQAAALLLAAASEQLLGDDEHAPLAARAADALTAAAARPGALGGDGALGAPGCWLALPLLLYAHALGGERGEALVAAGRRLILSASSFPELPYVWWDAERPATGLSSWAGAVVGAAVACQGEPELVPWCARVAAQKLPTALRGAAPLAAAHRDAEAAAAAVAAGDGATAVAEWAHNASVLMALHALARALPRGWPAVRRAERGAAALGAAALDALDAQPHGGPLVARLAVAFALYGFSVEPGGPRVCC